MLKVIGRGQPVNIPSNTPNQDEAIEAIRLLRAAIAPPEWITPETVIPVDGHTVPLGNISSDLRSGMMGRARTKSPEH